MTAPVAGIDPHQTQFTVGIVDATGVEFACETFPNTAAGFIAAIDLLITHGVCQVGIEGSASWGAHVAIAVVAAGFDAREVPPQRSATQRRSRRLAKTDAIDAVATARALLAEPSLGSVQRWRSTTRSWPSSKPCWSTAGRSWRPERCCCTTSVTSSPSCPPTSATSCPPAASSRRDCATGLHRHQRCVDPSWGVPPVMANPPDRAGPPGSPADPPARGSHRRTARRPRHHPA